MKILKCVTIIIDSVEGINYALIASYTLFTSALQQVKQKYLSLYL